MAKEGKSVDEKTYIRYRFSKDVNDWTEPAGSPNSRALLGGKGASLVSMTQIGLPVPPGFTLPTSVCKAYRAMTPALREQMLKNYRQVVSDSMDWLYETLGHLPLVSVRSGAPVSMPGMMDTILNVGLSDKQMPTWEKRIGKRAMLDSRRRLIQMLGTTAYHMKMDDFDAILNAVKKKAQVTDDADLGPVQLTTICKRYADLFHNKTTFDFPEDPLDQIMAAIRAVFESWDNPRAVEYRKINNISDEIGTAVTVQAMVFGNLNEKSGSGVLFTRCPSSGKNEIMAEYLANAQGEDVVAGIRTPDKLSFLDAKPKKEPAWLWELAGCCVTLEQLYRDMVDLEFTVQDGKLFILQSRVGKRSAQAAIKIAIDMHAEGAIDKREVFHRITPSQFKLARRDSIDPAFGINPNAVGLPACPGVAVGHPVFSAADAINCKVPCILVTHETDPDDIGGMNAAKGILTATGGATSHAAVVARAMDKPCVVGCSKLDIEAMKAESIHDPERLLTICGSTGRVWWGVAVAVIPGGDTPEIHKLAELALTDLDMAMSTPLLVDDCTVPQVIRVSEWWGDHDAADMVLDELTELTEDARKRVVLDLTSPTDLQPFEDQELLRAFSELGNYPQFAVAIQQKLQSSTYKGKLSGLSLMGVHPSTKIVSEGLRVIGDAATLAEFLAGNQASEHFIEKVVGGKKAFKQLIDILDKAKIEVPKTRAAIPKETAIFTRLQQSAD